MSEPNGPSDPQAAPSVLPAGPGDMPPPYVIPVRYPPQQPPRPAGSALLAWMFRSLLLFVLAISLGFNFLSFCLNPTSLGDLGDAASLPEKFHSGKSTARDKIAIVKLDGVIMDGMLGYVHKQIEQAVADENVKAVVFQINSPGGSVTASEDLHHRLEDLKAGKSQLHQKTNGSKKLVVSMGAIAASGGYYIAVPADKIVAEKTTITGSIGVYIPMLDIHEFSQKNGFTTHYIKQGDMKASGSMFNEMTPQERYMWQESVDHSYDRFIEVVETGRPQLKDKLRREHPVVNKKIPGKDGKEVDYVRYLADGGIYSSDDALKYQLIDQVGYLEDAIQTAKAQAGLTDYKAITYEKQPTLMNALFGTNVSASPPAKFDPASLAAAATPRMWYLAPQSELAGILAALKHD
jgi:protease-4